MRGEGVSTDRAIRGSALALREAFDRSFAEPRSPAAPHVERMIAIRVGTDAYAVSLSEVVSLHADHKVVAVPSTAPELLGLAGFRGAVVPVYDLRVLLGSVTSSAPRWLMLVRAPVLVALAFDLFDARLQVHVDDITGTLGQSPHGPHVSGSIQTSSGSRPILRVSSLLHALTSRPHPSGMAKDR